MWSGLPSGSEVPSLLWAGIWTGAISAVLGVAMVLIFRVARVINLAVGSIFVVGAMASVGLLNAGWPTPLVLLGVALVGTAVAVLQERVILAPLAREAPFTQLLATVGVAILIEGAIIVIEGRQPAAGRAIVNGVFELGPVSVTAAQTLLLGFAAILAIAGEFGLTRSRPGRAVCATTDDAEAAMMLGINVPRLRWITFGIAGACLAVAGYLASPVTLIDYSSGLPLSLTGFIAATVGGGRSPMAAAVGGVGLGLISSFAGRIFNANIAALSMAVVLVVLVLIVHRIPSFQALEGG